MKIIILCIFAIAITSVLADGCGRRDQEIDCGRECQQHEAPNKNVCAPSCGRIDAPINPRIPPPVVPNIRLPYELPNVRFPCGQVPFYPDHDKPHYPSDPHAFKTECDLERKYNHCECEKHEGEEEDDDDVDICFCKKEKKDDRRRWIRRSRIDDGDDDDEFDGEDRYNCRGDRCDHRRRRRSNYNDRKGDRLEEIKEEIKELKEEKKEEKAGDKKKE